MNIKKQVKRFIKSFLPHERREVEDALFKWFLKSASKEKLESLKNQIRYSEALLVTPKILHKEEGRVRKDYKIYGELTPSLMNKILAHEAQEKNPTEDMSVCFDINNSNSDYVKKELWDRMLRHENEFYSWLIRNPDLLDIYTSNGENAGVKRNKENSPELSNAVRVYSPDDELD